MTGFEHNVMTSRPLEDVRAVEPRAARGTPA